MNSLAVGSKSRRIEPFGLEMNNVVVFCHRPEPDALAKRPSCFVGLPDFGGHYPVLSQDRSHDALNVLAGEPSTVELRNPEDVDFVVLLHDKPGQVAMPLDLVE